MSELILFSEKQLAVSGESVILRKTQENNSERTNFSDRRRGIPGILAVPVSAGSGKTSPLR